MIPNPILKVLLTLSCHEVRHLLMGGQACVFYGAAEFSRDCDIVVLAERTNLRALQSALDELQGKCIAVPPFELQYLERGHAVHFRCQHPDAVGMRLDVMTRMRGCDAFPALWERRMTIQAADESLFEVLGIEDLVLAKKTQRDKDWPMITRLVDAHYAQNRAAATEDQVRFWLRESRTPEVLITLAAQVPELLNELLHQRGLLGAALRGDRSSLRAELEKERMREQEADRKYWQPLRTELEQLRRAKRPSE